jgi:hypothetical protein
MADLSFLQYAGVIDMILYLLKYPKGRRKVDIRKDLGLNSVTAKNAHTILTNHVFLYGISYEDATAYALTPGGIEVAKALKKVDIAMSKLEKTKNFGKNKMWFDLTYNKSYFKK